MKETEAGLVRRLTCIIVVTPAGPESEQEIQNYRTTIQNQADELQQLRDKVGQLESAMAAMVSKKKKKRNVPGENKSILNFWIENGG